MNPGFPAEKLWPEKMPDLIYMNVTSLCKYIRFMDSSEAMDEYLDTPNIGFNPSIPDIYVGIVFDKYPFFSFLHVLEFLMIIVIGHIQSVLINLVFPPCILKNCILH